MFLTQLNTRQSGATNEFRNAIQKAIDLKIANLIYVSPAKTSFTKSDVDFSKTMKQLSDNDNVLIVSGSPIKHGSMYFTLKEFSLDAKAQRHDTPAGTKDADFIEVDLSALIK